MNTVKHMHSLVFRVALWSISHILLLGVWITCRDNAPIEWSHNRGMKKAQTVNINALLDFSGSLFAY